MRLKVRKDALRLLAVSGLGTSELSLVLVGDRAIRTLNRNFRGQDKTTDVLSFPQVDATNRPGNPKARRKRTQSDLATARSSRTPTERSHNAQTPLDTGPLLLGDIVISVDTALRQARELGVSPRARLRTLLIHGLLHLLGYDHEHSANEARRMFARESELAARLDGAMSRRPGDPHWPPAAMPLPAPASSTPRLAARPAVRRRISEHATTSTTRRTR